jgi:hypothetical protein
LEGGITAVVGTQDRVLEATGIGNGNVQLAVLALLGDRNAGADGGTKLGLKISQCLHNSVEHESCVLGFTYM